MKAKIFFIVVLLLFSSLDASASDKNISFGLGLGALYGGVGINIGLQRESDFRYVAAGCPELGYDSVSGWQAACGVGVGWIWTDILSKSNNKHGIGFYAGPVGYEGSHRDPEIVYGVGVSYDYFFKGINSSGWNVGVTPAIGRRNGDTKGYILLQVGYQF